MPPLRVRPRAAPFLLRWVLAALLLAAAAAQPAQPRIVVVFPTWPPRYGLVAAGRETWRRGTPTLVVTEGDAEGPIASPIPGAPATETWWAYPDDPRKDAWKKGDQKLAASYRIANETFAGQYECARLAARAAATHARAPPLTHCTTRAQLAGGGR
jgi:hypothetical protein